MQMSNLVDVLSKLCTQTYHRQGLGAELPAAGGYGGLGTKPPALGEFCKFLEKKAILIPLDHILHVFTVI